MERKRKQMALPICETCGKKYRQLEKHLLSVIHKRGKDGKEPIQCSHCQKIFKISSSYRSHVSRKHGNKQKKSQEIPS